MHLFRFNCLGANYSPFSNPGLSQQLSQYGFKSGNLLNSNLVVVRTTSRARKVARIFPWKKVISWTHEPSYDLERISCIEPIIGRPISIFNVFTGNVFWHNLHFLGSYHYDESCDLGLTRGEFIDPARMVNKAFYESKRSAVVVCRRKSINEFLRLKDGSAIDLNRKRQELAVLGYSRGLCDIVGHGWGGMAKEDSGFCNDQTKPWWTRKLELLEGYRYCLAFENTNWPYYVTEKIWHAIKAGCLPVYWGAGNSIYTTFPRDSFVDASEFPDDDTLWRFLQQLSYDEWTQRMERCIKVYNTSMQDRKRAGYPFLDEVMTRIKSGIA